MADDPVEHHEPTSSEPHAAGDPDASKEKKGSFWQKHKVELIAAAVGILVTIYLYMKSKGAASTATTATAAPTDATTPTDTGGGSGGGSSGSGSTGDNSGGNSHRGGNGNGNGSNDTTNTDLSNLTGEIGSLEAQNAADAAAEQAAIAAQISSLGTSAQVNIPTNLSPGQAQGLVSSGNLNPVQALQDETPAANETAAQRHQQEIANRGLRTQAGLGSGTPAPPKEKEPTAKGKG